MMWPTEGAGNAGAATTLPSARWSVPVLCVPAMVYTFTTRFIAISNCANGSRNTALASSATSSYTSASPQIAVAPAPARPPAERLSIVVRAYRFASVIMLALRIYLPYKAIQLWSRVTKDGRKEARYRRQDLHAARALYRTSIRLE